MSIQAIVKGDETKPILACIHGMLGDPSNFETLAEAWGDKVCLVLLDVHPQNRQSGLGDSATSLKNASYDRSAREIYEFLSQRFPHRKYYLFGISLGGKIVFDFAANFPHAYAGGLVTDVGPGSFRGSSLYEFCTQTIPSINLEQDWEGIRKDVRAKLTVRPIQVLTLTQVEYLPEEKRGRWKSAVHGLREFLDTTKIADQWDLIERIPERTIVLHASAMSGIPNEDLERMRHIPQFEIVEIEGAAHFMHVSHTALLQEAVLALIEHRKLEINETTKRAAPAPTP